MEISEFRTLRNSFQGQSKEQYGVVHGRHSSSSRDLNFSNVFQKHYGLYEAKEGDTCCWTFEESM